MKAVRLSTRARRRLDEIGEWSAEHFGRRRGDAYAVSLLGKCRAIAAGRVNHQSCRRHFADDLREDLRFARVGKHFLIFVETATAIDVVDFIHQSSDVGARLAAKDGAPANETPLHRHHPGR